jgi:hypothetical protein
MGERSNFAGVCAPAGEASPAPADDKLRTVQDVNKTVSRSVAELKSIFAIIGAH